MRPLKFRSCARCGKHKSGKIYNFEGKDCCAKCWRDRLDWDEQRNNLVAAIRAGAVFGVSVTPQPDTSNYERLRAEARQASDDAAFYLKYTDTPREFTRAFVRAMWAWEEMR